MNFEPTEIAKAGLGIGITAAVGAGVGYMIGVGAVAGACFSVLSAVIDRVAHAIFSRMIPGDGLPSRFAANALESASRLYGAGLITAAILPRFAAYAATINPIAPLVVALASAGLVTWASHYRETLAQEEAAATPAAAT